MLSFSPKNSYCEPLPYTVSSSQPHHILGQPTLRWGIAVALVLLSWVTSYSITDPSVDIIGLENELIRLAAYLEHVQNEVVSLQSTMQQERSKWKLHQRTSKVLQHELRILEQLASDETQTQQHQRKSKYFGTATNQHTKDNHHIILTNNNNNKATPPPNNPNDPTIQKQNTLDLWFRHRHTTLTQQTHHLQSYLQAQSRAAVETIYGPGPFYIRITIDLANPHSRRRELVSFTVVTAQTRDAVPYTLHWWLDSVHHGVWDHTVFVHTATTDHVVLAAPYRDNDSTNTQQAFGQLGWAWQLGLAEYDPHFPHTPYTLGVAGRGPNWYINTQNNTIAHGPGGQQQRSSATVEADPCFGRVLERDEKVVDALVAWGMEQTELKLTGESDNEEHRKTRIVSMELLATQ